MQAPLNRRFSSKNISIAFALVWFLMGSYLLLYSGIRVSNDEIYLFDSTESFARRGDFQLNFTFNLQPNLDAQGNPDRPGLYEPLQPILAAPLFLVSQAIPGMGMMQTVWMFNILVTMITALIIYSAGLLWSYGGGISALTALLFGIGTLAFPYSGTYFREPLATLFTLIAFISAYQIGRDRNASGKRWGASLCFAIICIALTKVSTLVILPSLAILVLPAPSRLRNWLKRPTGLAIVVALLVVLGVVLLFTLSDVLPERFSYTYIAGRLEATDWNDVIESVIGYQISFGRSIWLYSPILLAGLVGFWINRKHGGGRFLLALLLALVTLPASFGIIHHQLWWSGTGWGPRYLLPLVPVLMLGIFPIIDLLRTVKLSVWHVLFASLAFISVAIQLIGMLVFAGDYFSKLSDVGIVVWEKGLWTWQWSSIRQNLILLDFQNLNVAWVQAHVSTLSGVLAMLAIVTLLVGGIGLWFFREKVHNFSLILGVITLVFVPLTMGLRLLSIDDDPRYGSDDTETMQMIDELDAASSADDVIFIQNPEIALAFMNTFNTSALVFTLPDAPGERHNPDVPPRVVSDNLVDLTSVPTAALIDFEAARHDTLWLVMPYGPFNAFTIRPTERYMVEHDYPVSEIAPSQRARAIRFYSADASPENDWQSEQAYRFGDLLELSDATLPDGRTFSAGDVVPVALMWQPLDDIDRDYSISVQIGDLQTIIPLVQRDTTPQGQFGYTSRWQLGESYIDHHGLLLPDGIEFGQYCLNVILYYWEDGARLNIEADDGDPVGDVLCLTQITID